MITEIKRYETFDGLEFDNFDDAYSHEVETRDAFKDVFFYNEKCEQIDMIKWMDNYEYQEPISFIIFGDSDMNTLYMVAKAVCRMTGIDIVDLVKPYTAFYWDNMEHCFHMFDGDMLPWFLFMRDKLAELSATAS